MEDLLDSIDGRPASMGGPRSVVVAVDATKELQLAALEYALKNCVSPGDNLYLLGILHQVNNPSTSPPKKSIHAGMLQTILGYKQVADTGMNFNGTNKYIILEETSKKYAEFQKVIDTDPELQKLSDSKQVTPVVKIAAGGPRKEVTAQQALELRATWVILDKNLQKDKAVKAYLKDKLNCYILFMNAKNEAAIVGVPYADNQTGSFQDQSSMEMPSGLILPRGFPDSFAQLPRLSKDFNPINHESATASDTDSTSPEPQYNTAPLFSSIGTVGGSTMTEISNSSPPHGISDQGGESAAESDEEVKSKMALEGEKAGSPDGQTVNILGEQESLSLRSTEMVASTGSLVAETARKRPPDRPMSTRDLQSLMARHPGAPVFRPASRNTNEGARERAGDELKNILNPSADSTAQSSRTLERSFRDELDRTPESQPTDNGAIAIQSALGSQNDQENRPLADSSARTKTPRPVAPLCSECKHPGPVFGRDAIKFTYAQLEEATNNFDQENYLAEGGYGFVYQGTLKGGQKIAVKQYKPASSQGDDEFYSEVDVLKHAQHRNLVILIGYCAELNKRLLVYEFVCNKSLDVHLSAKNPKVLEWKWRWKVAVGAARGLRYLHEECRGCIVHRDMRPNNILLTHDFVPMVGDFGLARNQLNGDNPEETRVIGTLGYLAPEYAESGSITEKADVYSFGVVLLELITGRKAIDATRVRGETCLTEWARPLIQVGKTQEIVDPRLKDEYDKDQVDKMVDAAGRCICKDPSQRPKMSEVLRILERDPNSISMSRDNSANDLSNMSGNPAVQRIVYSNKPSRQNSVDSHLAKESAKLILSLNSHKGPSEVAHPRRNKNPLSSERASSPGGKSLYSSSQSFKGKKTSKLFYHDMLS